MALVKLSDIRDIAYENGRQFGAAGAYRRIDAIAHYAVDPGQAANQAIVDLDNAIRGDDGLVHFSGDVTLLVPELAESANGAVLVEVPNRGNRIALRSFNMAPGDFASTANIAPGDGFLLERGWCIAWCGWQWDVPRSHERIGLEAPVVDPVHLQPRTQMQLRIQPNMGCRSLRLTDQHVGSIGNHRLIETCDVDDATARLTVRTHLAEPPRDIARQTWRFARDEGGQAIADAGHIWLDGGFEAGLIYDVYYTPRECPVVGAGLLAVRDFGAYLRSNAQAPTAGMAQHLIVEGQSQCGRFLRTFLQLGLNCGEHGESVYDGMLMHIAGARRGEFNHRYGQPSVQPTPGFGHLHPFADEAQTDPRSGVIAGLLDRQRELGMLPKIFYTDTSSEYHRGDAALSHLVLGAGESVQDAALPSNVRRYLYASTQHGPGGLPFAKFSLFGTRSANHFNIVDYRPLYRASLTNLLEWIADGTTPPDSVVPRISDGTAVQRAQAYNTLAKIPGLVTPAPDYLPWIRPLDVGPRGAEGVGEFPTPFAGEPYPAWVSALDEIGNETGGVRMPDVEVPVATNTGFNSRDPRTGGDGHLLDYLGSALPLPPDESERMRHGDPRVSIAERYAGRDDYLTQIRQAAARLVDGRYLVTQDIDICVQLAAERFDACSS